MLLTLSPSWWMFHSSVLRWDMKRLFVQVSDTSVTSYSCFYISLFRLPEVKCDMKNLTESSRRDYF